jgi:imidazolonepropionase-like amidohydrolase
VLLHQHRKSGAGICGYGVQACVTHRSTVLALVTAGVDSIEHGYGLDQAALNDMARRGTAWTPTIGALLTVLDAPFLPPERRHSVHESRERLAELLPLAARLGIPVLAGTDVTDSIPGRWRCCRRWASTPKTR